MQRQEEDDGLDAARGFMWATVGGLIAWAVIIAIVMLGIRLMDRL